MSAFKQLSWSTVQNLVLKQTLYLLSMDSTALHYSIPLLAVHSPGDHRTPTVVNGDNYVHKPKGK